MTEEKRIILKKIDELIYKKRTKLIKELPSIHKIEDGVIIRFFTEWDFCDDNNGIRFKKIINVDNTDESVVFFFIPKGVFFDLKQRFYVGCMTCLNGRVDIIVNNETRFLECGMKICVESAEVQGLALENTYIITTSNRKSWSNKTVGYIKNTY